MAAVKRTPGATVTKSGTTLGGDADHALLEEAEAGFDAETLVRRHAGRPSLSGRTGHSNRVDLRVDDQTYQAIRRIADQGHRNVSDVVRDAIRRYIEAS